MQRPKEEIYHKILKSAKEEFLKNGFKKASLRIITKKSGIALGNIYNYFKNKDHLLEIVLEPVLKCLEQIFEDHNRKERINIEEFFSVDQRKRNIAGHLNLIKKFRQELHLLFLGSHGSSLEGYRESLIERHTESSFEYIELLKEKYPHLECNVSDFFIHNMSGWWINILEEMVSHNITDAQVESFFNEFYSFSTAGWSKLLGVK